MPQRLCLQCELAGTFSMAVPGVRLPAAKRQCCCLATTICLPRTLLAVQTEYCILHLVGQTMLHRTESSNRSKPVAGCESLAKANLPSRMPGHHMDE
jgi:hypothetical protein